MNVYHKRWDPVTLRKGLNSVIFSAVKFFKDLVVSYVAYHE